ncbi:MAG TPA: hypothetical protein VGR35_15860 [Tepidisphaeraceae bacterium]|nr:hypothetical protein [Tepidisphaeraceae bacterium]
MTEKQLSDEQMLKIIEKTVKNYEGDFTVLESALGALVIGREVGWQGLRVCHSGRTFKRYEEILDIKFRDVLPERTKHSTRLRGIRIADSIGKFWQAISSGMIPARDAKEMGSR